MRLTKREAKVNGERWFAHYSPVEKDTGKTVEDDADFRFRLGRTWDIEQPPIMFIGLNPSTATHLANDRTVARCCADAKRWGFGGMFMMNLFPFRATDPYRMKAFYKNPFLCRAELWDETQLINTREIITVGGGCEAIVCAWGNHGQFMKYGERMRQTIWTHGFGHRLHCYKITKQGEPEHPLYQSFTSDLQPYNFSR